MKRPTAGILAGYGLRATYGEGACARPSGDYSLLGDCGNKPALAGVPRW